MFGRGVDDYGMMYRFVTRRRERRSLSRDGEVRREVIVRHMYPFTRNGALDSLLLQTRLVLSYTSESAGLTS